MKTQAPWDSSDAREVEKTEQLVGPGMWGSDGVSGPCCRFRLAGFHFWQKAALLLAAQGWALPEDPMPVGSVGRRERWLMAVPEEVVSSSQIRARG